MNRRKFAVSALVAFGLASLPACVFSNIYKSITRYIPYALLAIDRIIDILAEHGISISDSLSQRINAAKAALADIQAAIAEFEDAPHQDKNTVAAVIRTALKIGQERLEDFWRELKIPKPELAATIRALLNVIISTLAGFQMELPGEGTKLNPPGAKTIFGVPKARSLKEFREDFNRILRHAGEDKFVI